LAVFFTNAKVSKYFIAAVVSLLFLKYSTLDLSVVIQYYFKEVNIENSGDLMKLYTYYRSTAAYRVRIALNYKQVDYDSIPVNLLEGKQFNQDYEAVNPQMRVPTLVDGTFILGQSMAILEYLEEKYPKPALLPDDLAERAQVRFIAQLIASDIHPLNNVSVLNYLKQTLHHDQKTVNEWYFNWLEKGFNALETLLAAKKGPFALGDTLTIADVCLIPQISNAFRFGFSMDAYPRLLDINEHCLTLPFFEKAKPENQADAVIS
jgi:maleylacetoacetate isomerase